MAIPVPVTVDPPEGQAATGWFSGERGETMAAI
jgi:hypothetical protein